MRFPNEVSDQQQLQNGEESGPTGRNSPCARLCQLRRWDGMSYGFNLISKRGQTGHFIDNIEYGLPAHHSGLKDGDRVVEIDGKDVCEEPHREVVKMIKASDHGLAILVVDAETEQYFRSKGLKITSNSCNHRIQVINCPLTRPDVDGEKSHKKEKRESLFKRFSTPEPPPPSPPHLAVETVYATLGNPAPDRTPQTYINGETNEKRVQKGPKLPSSKNAISSAAREMSHLAVETRNGSASGSKPGSNPIARLCQMVKSPHEDFGFVLRTYNDTNEKVIVRLDRGSVAERTGIQEKDHVIEMNGVNVAKENHSQTCARIRRHGDEVSLLVVGVKEMMWFRRQSVIPKARDCEVFRTKPSQETTHANHDRDGDGPVISHPTRVHSQGVPVTATRTNTSSATSSNSTIKADTETDYMDSQQFQLEEYSRDEERKDCQVSEAEEDNPIGRSPIQGTPIRQRNGNGISDMKSSSNNTIDRVNSREAELMDKLNGSAADARNRLVREGRRFAKTSKRASRGVEEEMI